MFAPGGRVRALPPGTGTDAPLSAGAAPSSLTERLFLEDPVRAHCLAVVTQVRGQAVVLDRTVLYGESKAYGHPQPGDRGHLLAEGRKIKIDRVNEREGVHLHHLAGAPPARGAKVQVHLDLPRRLVNSRAHTLAHLAVHAARAQKLIFAEPPRVVGGGVVRAKVKGNLTGFMERVQALVAADRPVTARWALPEGLPNPAPWTVPMVEGSVRLVEVAEVGALPCDGTHARRTLELGKVTARARPAWEWQDLELVVER